MRTVPFNQPINQCTKKWKGKCNLEQNIEKEMQFEKFKVKCLTWQSGMGHQLTTCLWINVKLGLRFVEVIFILSFIAQIWKGFIIIIVVSVSS
jgi:hypothetical protein